MEPGTERKRIRPRAKRAGTFHHGDLREALVLAATQAVERLGYADVSLRPLADKLGVSQPAVYRHFANKDALLGEVATRAGNDLTAALNTAGMAEAVPLEALRATGRAYIDWAIAHPNLFRLIASRVPAQHRGGAVAPMPPREHFYYGLGRSVPIDDPRLADAFRAAWALVHGLASFIVEQTFQLVNTDEARIAAADGALDVFVEMVAARWPQPST